MGIPCRVDTLWIFVTAAGLALVIGLFSLVVGVKLDRWRSAPESKAGRQSTARVAVMLALVIGGAAFGTAFLQLGGVWIAVGAVVIVGGVVSGIVVGRTGRKLPPLPPPSDVGHHEGLSYFWHCWLPQKFLDAGRAVAMAVVAPPAAVVLVVFEKWLGAALFAAGAIVSWSVLLFLKSSNVPQRGPCARPE